MPAGAAVVGVGESPYYRRGESPYSLNQLTAMAITRAVADAGLAPRDVDGIVTWRDSRSVANLASWLGLGSLHFSAQGWGGGHAFGTVVAIADAAIRTGSATTLVAFRALQQGPGKRYGRTRVDAIASGEHAYLTPFGVSAPAVKDALLTSAFMHRSGITQDALAEIALACYSHAQQNPRAIMYGRPLSREAYHESRWISEPFHLYDCCQESDGASAIVMTSATRAGDLPQPPAYVLATATGMERRGGMWAFSDSAFPHGRFRTVGEQIWASSGCGPADVQVAQFYDNFTGTTLMAIADMGFCAVNELEDFVSGGNIVWPYGRLPVNTSGGNLAEAYVNGFQLINEAVRQVRGQSTAQVENVELSLCVAGPGTPPSSAILFARDR